MSDQLLLFSVVDVLSQSKIRTKAQSRIITPKNDPTFIGRGQEQVHLDDPLEGFVSATRAKDA
jgi:hypothetical protein